MRSARARPTHRALAPLLAAEMSGDIVMVTSDAARRPRPGQLAYGASKAGLENYADALGMALEGSGIRVIKLRLGPAVSEFGRTIVNSCLTLSVVVGMSVSDLSQKAIANLGWDHIKLTAPVFPGDTLYAESEVLAKRESNSRPGQGIVTAKTIGKKADGTVVMSCERSFLVPKKGQERDG